MASKVLKAEKAVTGYHFLVHLDTDMWVPDPENEGEFLPDPAWLYEVVFGPLQPSTLPLHPKGGHNATGEFLHACTTQHGKNLTEREYLANINEQLDHQIELELERRQGTAASRRHKREPLPAFEGREIQWQ